MTNEGEKLRIKFLARMAQIAPGAVLATRRFHWTVQAIKRHDTFVTLTLARGRRTFRVTVPLCMSGPELWEAGLRVVTPPPQQRDMFGTPAEAA